jgi:hypothetical protein
MSFGRRGDVSAVRPGRRGIGELRRHIRRRRPGADTSSTLLIADPVRARAQRAANPSAAAVMPTVAAMSTLHSRRVPQPCQMLRSRISTEHDRLISAGQAWFRSE